MRGEVETVAFELFEEGKGLAGDGVMVVNCQRVSGGKVFNDEFLNLVKRKVVIAILFFF